MLNNGLLTRALKLETTTLCPLSKCYASTNSSWWFICRKWFIANGQSLQGLVAFPNGNPINSSRWPFCFGHWALVIGLVQPNSITTPNVSHKHTKSLLQSVPTRHLKRKRLNRISFFFCYAAFIFFGLPLFCCLMLQCFFICYHFQMCSYADHFNMQNYVLIFQTFNMV